MATVAESAPGLVRVFLLDDHEVVRRGVADLLEAEADLTVVGEAGTAAEALARVPAVRPDVAVLDVRLPDGNGVDGLPRAAVAACRSMRCLMLTSFADDDALLRRDHGRRVGLRAQADPRHRPGRRRADGRGRTARCWTRTTTARVLERLRDGGRAERPGCRLTEQERTVLELIGEGLTNRQIGERMFLAEKTVKNYVSHLLAKLGMQRRTQAAVLATELRRAGDLRGLSPAARGSAQRDVPDQRTAPPGRP